MSGGPLQLALREWRDRFRHPTTLICLAGTSVILAIIAPFDGDVLLRPLPRLAYWMMVVTTTYAAGLWVNIYILHHWADRLSRQWRLAVIGLATATCVSVLVWVLNGMWLGFWPAGTALAVYLAQVFVIALIVAILIEAVLQRITTAPAPRVGPSILDRLPLDKRGTLLAMSVEDHYVRVTTTKGQEMILMRLSDAIRETAATPGLQVHRSHWVATAAVAAADRKGDGAVLTLADGTQIPVSRRYIPAIKEAGLLPAR
ncbi:LytTr DNA-binding domain-containing protein [Loktanella sp. DSM 29012]|uniref:LytTR family DNA-binding domain-containing protein n=1 Tax=Loktanella sp. DSM 29012 TaxID=1881056 RepID=UPI0008CB33D9|nr:LytTR family DNA-binding domain-containing protein [Loktanella sp. DSM 29012]SEQ56419.1 LytTr DNA-binding domain-containing protein [Loktanella sp. DSM 29012]